MARPKAEPVQDDSFDGWVPKADVMRLLQASEKTVERMIAKGVLRHGQKRVPGRRPLVVCHPEDVERERSKTLETAATALAVAGAEPPKWIELLSKLVDRDTEARTEQTAILLSLSTAIADLQNAARLALPASNLTRGKKARVIPLESKLLLTVPECQTLTGLSREIIREAIDTKTLKAALVKRTYRIRRADLDAFLASL